jgi:hypothetical protein
MVRNVNHRKRQVRSRTKETEAKVESENVDYLNHNDDDEMDDDGEDLNNNDGDEMDDDDDDGEDLTSPYTD